MNIFITGGLGFVGRHLSNGLLQDGHRVTAIGRTSNPDMIDHPDFRYLAADTPSLVVGRKYSRITMWSSTWPASSISPSVAIVSSGRSTTAAS